MQLSGATAKSYTSVRGWRRLTYNPFVEDVRDAAGARDTGNRCAEPKMGSTWCWRAFVLGRAVLLYPEFRGCSAFACLLFLVSCCCFQRRWSGIGAEA
jgi:hypothetical protein